MAKQPKFGVSLGVVNFLIILSFRIFLTSCTNAQILFLPYSPAKNRQKQAKLF